MINREKFGEIFTESVWTFLWADSTVTVVETPQQSWITTFLSNSNANCYISGSTILLIRRHKLPELWWPEKWHLREFLPNTEHTGESVFSQVCFGQRRDCHWNASVNTRFCQLSVLLFGIQSNRRISIREHFHPSAYRPTELQLHILFLALLLLAVSQLYSLK